MTNKKNVQVVVYREPDANRDAVYYVQSQEKSRVAFVSYEEALSFAEEVALQGLEVLLLCVPLGAGDGKPFCMAVVT